MTSEHNGGPDEILGRLLREEFEPPHHAAFVTRIRAGIRRAERETIWETLSAWARPGMIAAGGVALALALWLTRAATSEGYVPTLADAVESTVPAQLLLGDSEAGAEAVLAGIVGDR